MKRTVLTSLVLGTAVLATGSADATMITVQLNKSAENFTLYGTGGTAIDPNVGTFRIGQGASSYDSATNLSTFTLTGTIGSSTLAGFGSGTYEIITTYIGVDSPMAGPMAPYGQSNPSNLNFFYYTGLDATMNMTLLLHNGGNTFTQSLVGNGLFSGAGFGFGFVGSACTGVAVCGQNEVGITPGATIFGPVTTSVSFELPDTPVPEPTTWAMMVGGFGLVGAAMRRRQRTTMRFA